MYWSTKKYDGKEVLPDEVSLPCVDWPFYIVLSKTVGNWNKVFNIFFKKLSGLLP